MNDVIFTLKSDKARKVLKDIWSIDISGTLYRLTLGYFCRSHMETRNHFVAKFLDFNKEKHTLVLLLDILKSHDARNAYTKSGDSNIYVKFPTEQDMTNACLYTYYNYNMKITGY